MSSLLRFSVCLYHILQSITKKKCRLSLSVSVFENKTSTRRGSSCSQRSLQRVKCTCTYSTKIPTPIMVLRAKENII